MAFGAFQFIVPKYNYRLGKRNLRSPASLFREVTVFKAVKTNAWRHFGFRNVRPATGPEPPRPWNSSKKTLKIPLTSTPYKELKKYLTNPKHNVSSIFRRVLGFLFKGTKRVLRQQGLYPLWVAVPKTCLCPGFALYLYCVLAERSSLKTRRIGADPIKVTLVNWKNLKLWSGRAPNSTETQKELEWPKSDSQVTPADRPQSNLKLTQKWLKNDSNMGSGVSFESLLGCFGVRPSAESLLSHFCKGRKERQTRLFVPRLGPPFDPKISPACGSLFFVRSFSGNEAHKLFFPGSKTRGVLGGGQKVYVEKAYVLLSVPYFGSLSFFLGSCRVRSTLTSQT